MYKVWLFLLGMFLFVGCGKNIESVKTEPVEELQVVTIPESYFSFTNSDAEEVAENYKDYCVSAYEDEGNVVLWISEKQKETLINEYIKFIDDVLKDFYSDNEKYSCDMGDSYEYITFSYDENIDSFLQGKILLGVTSSYVLNGILETGNSDWNIHLTVKNCHNGNIVAECDLPEGDVFFDENDWEESYN